MSRRLGRQNRRLRVGPTFVFNPTQISGLTLWLSAGTITPNAGKVDTWNDSSSAGIAPQFLQATGASQPTYTVSGINSKPDVLGTTTTTGLWSTSQASLGSTAMTMATCVSRATSNVGRMLGGARSNAHHYSIEVDVTNGGQALFRLNTSVTGVVLIKSDSTSILSDGTPHRIICTWDGATMKMFVDGVQQAQTAACTGTIIVPSTNSDNNSVMCSTTNTGAVSLGWDGHMTDWVTYNVALTGTNLTNLDAFLAAQ